MGNGWKQILALPVKRSTIFLSKLFMVILLLAGTQTLLLIFFLLLGSLFQIPSPLPFLEILVFTGKGLYATFPLAAIQLIISIYYRSFGVPLAINIAFTLPVLTVYGQYYPWAQPALAMSPADETPLDSLLRFYILISVLFIMITYIGIKVFEKRDLPS
nr:ABC transporter permease [Thermoflavimicrobium daqui]